MEAEKLTENQIIRDAREFALHYTPFKRAPQQREDYQEAFEAGSENIRAYFEEFLLAIEKQLGDAEKRLTEFEKGQLDAFYWMQDHLDGLFGE
jgi:hypothetical protein